MKVPAMVAALCLMVGAAQAQTLGVIDFSVEQAWSGIAPCLTTQVSNTGEVSVEVRLDQLVLYAPVADAKIVGIQFRDQPQPLLDAFRQLTALLPRSGEGIEGRVPADCHEVLCATKALLGEDVGPRLLLIATAYHFNGSPLGEKTTQPWTADELDLVIAAFEDLPPAIFPLDPNEYRALVHRHDLAWEAELADTPVVIAAESGRVVGGIAITHAWHVATPAEQRAIIVHELAHEFVRAQRQIPDWRRVWLRAVDADAAAAPPGQSSAPSAYAELNLDEDFAESVVAYRYIAPLLKRHSPHRYALLRDWMFGGLEYGSGAACKAGRRMAQISGRDVSTAQLLVETHTSHSIHSQADHAQDTGMARAGEHRPLQAADRAGHIGRGASQTRQAAR